MPGPVLIDPTQIPGRELDPDGMDAAARSLGRVGRRVVRNGAQVLSAWQGLATCFDTPGDEDLFTAMDPVASVTREFGAGWAVAARALVACAEEIRPIQAELARLRGSAERFVAAVAGGVDMVLPSSTANPDAPDTIAVSWWEDPATLKRNNDLVAAVNVQVALLWEAHRGCANAINEVTGKPYVDAPGGYDGHGRGVPVAIPAGTPMPWGADQPRPETCGGAVLRGVVWHGLAEGLVGGTVQGVGALAGFDLPGLDPRLWDHSWAAAADTWSGLGLAGSALVPKLYDVVPGGRDPRSDPRALAEDAALRALLAAGFTGAVRVDLRERGDTAAANGATAVNLALLAAGLVKGAGRAARTLDPDPDTPPTKGSLDAASRRARAEAALRIQGGVRLADLKAQIDAINLEKLTVLSVDRRAMADLDQRAAADDPPRRGSGDRSGDTEVRHGESNDQGRSRAGPDRDGSTDGPRRRSGVGGDTTGTGRHASGGADGGTGDDGPSATVDEGAPQGPDRDELTADEIARDPGFNPHRDTGPLGRHFRVGVHDPEGKFLPKERDTAEFLAKKYGDSWHKRAEGNAYRQRNPDAIVRTSPDDPGTVTEFKELKEKGSPDRSASVRREIAQAAAQVADHRGAVVIDGRRAGLSHDDAVRGFKRAMGQLKTHDAVLPQRVRIILGDGDVLDYKVEGA